jgi:hypothetical protein
MRPEGIRWIARNYARLNLKTAAQSEKEQFLNDLDDDRPFNAYPVNTQKG